MADRDPDIAIAEDDFLNFAVSEDLTPSPAHRQAGTTALDFDGLLPAPHSLKLRQDLARGNGGQAWPAGVVLVKYLLRRRREELREKRILELGAGGGLVGLAVALGCQSSQTVHITDQEPMLELMRQNIALNLLEDRVRASVLDWGSSSSSAWEHLQVVPGSSDDPSTSTTAHAATTTISSTTTDAKTYPDILLAADCVYFEPAFPLLQQTLRDLIGPNTTCFFCFKKRRRADAHFMTKIRKEFDVQAVADDPDAEAYGRESIFLFTIRRKKVGTEAR